MIVESICIIGDIMRLEFISEDGHGDSIDAPKKIGFEWLEETFHTVSLNKVKGEEVSDYAREELKARADKADTAGAVRAESDRQVRAAEEAIRKEPGIVDSVASWFWEGDCASFDVSGLSSTAVTDKWQTFGPLFRHAAVWERFKKQLQSQYPRRWYCMIRRDKYADCHRLLDMMNKEGGDE